MAQQLINVGTAANDRTGDTWRDAMIKVNANETELFDSAIANRVIINSASDFPATVGGKIPLAANTEYYIATNSITVSDEFTVASNVTFNGANGASQLTYTGTGSMFEGDGIDLFVIKNVALNLPSGQLFAIVDTIQNTVINLLKYRIVACAGLGTVTGVLAFVMEFGTIVDMDQGIALSGSISVISVDKLFGFSTKATFKAIDLGTSVSSTVELTNMALSAPAGAIGISGAASNANLTAGSVAEVASCEFNGGMSALSGITEDDIRWNFQNNSGVAGVSIIKDTNPNALVSLTANAVDTSISAVNTPALVAGTWVVEGASHFTGTAAGRITYNGEKALNSAITIAVDFEPVSGTNKDLKAYVAFNGTAVNASGRLARVDSGDPKSITIVWQLTFTTNDFVEVFVENTTDAVDILVSGSVSRVR